jgi:drug/metabolite transporter (DMT)-like permease
MKILVWLILCAIWGTTWVFIKIGLGDLPPVSFAGIRFTLAAIGFLLIVLMQNIAFPRGRKEIMLLAITGILQFGFNYTLLFWGGQYISSGLAAVLQATIPAFGLIFAWLYLPDERITALKISAIALGVVGVGVIFAEQLKIESWLAFAGCAAVVAGAACAAWASVLVKSFGGNIHPASLSLTQMLFGVPPVMLLGAATEGSPIHFHWTWTAVFCVVYLAIFGTIITFWLYYWLLRRVESTKAMMISLVTPLIAVLVGGAALGELLPLQTILGGLLILTSIALVMRRPKRGQTLAADPDSVV